MLLERGRTGERASRWNGKVRRRNGTGRAPPTGALQKGGWPDGRDGGTLGKEQDKGQCSDGAASEASLVVVEGARAFLAGARGSEAVAAACLKPALLLLQVQLLLLLLMDLLLLKQAWVEPTAVQCGMIRERLLQLLMMRVKLAGREWPAASGRRLERGRR